MSFVLKYCPTSTVVRNPAPGQNLITRFFVVLAFPLVLGVFCNRSSSCAGSSVKGVCVSSSHLAQTMGQIVLPQQVCSNMAGFAFFTQI